ncbi:hypothetical protein SAMN02745225_01560 [Ferrithrix thermotolerans DSM 19514]|uniref:Uncharacterized protein n=1 Tax=Ferrithrix thermotolerans DSM 19514 TaxID=1121881 RepID=A0A1M4W6K2_9ACTN|nr:hypothetical protein SAMN02745225_01560 [Ferrithrix thermotolerans DSM 19514]
MLHAQRVVIFCAEAVRNGESLSLNTEKSVFAMSEIDDPMAWYLP